MQFTGFFPFSFDGVGALLAARNQAFADFDFDCQYQVTPIEGVSAIAGGRSRKLWAPKYRFRICGTGSLECRERGTVIRERR
jgi:hypothetical protein